MKKLFKYGLILIPIIIIGIWFIVFYLPKTEVYKNFTVKKAPPVTAVEIAKDFLNDETAAFTKYSGKQIEVSGEVINSQIENGKTAVYLKTDDDGTQIYFLLKDSLPLFNLGTTITLKGICTGYLGDVQFNEGEIIK